MLTRKQLLALIALTLMWGVNWPMMKLSLRELSPLYFRAITMTLGASWLWLFFRARGVRMLPHGTEWKTVVTLALPNMLGWHTISIFGVKELSSGRAAILGFTMPGFATSEGTKSNAWALMKALGVTGAEIDIRPAAERMLKDIGHPYADGQSVHDITFENVQAGLRTDYLFRLANQNRGFVLGTGDLSELALGWCT